MNPTQRMQAVTDVAEIVQFENWLRFYFLQERGDDLVMEIPEQALERIRAKHPGMAGLVEDLNGRNMDYQASCNAVCEYVATTIDGKAHPVGTAEKVFDLPEFQMEMKLFGVWAQAHEEQLDQGFLDFATWQELFEQWKASKEVQEHFEAIRGCRPGKGKAAPGTLDAALDDGGNGPSC